MQSTLCDVDLWREYAAQMRTLSGVMTDASAKQRTLEAAAGFDHIAQLASKLAPSGKRSFLGVLRRAA